MPHPHSRLVIDTLYPIERSSPPRPARTVETPPPASRPICFEPLATEPRPRPWAEPEESHLIDALMIWVPICFAWYVICVILIAVAMGRL